MVKGRDRQSENDDPFFSDGEICPVCKQEYTGFCPINSNRCPYAEEGDEDDEESDFDDVDDLDKLLDQDEEADRLVEEGEEEAPPDDLDRE